MIETLWLSLIINSFFLFLYIKKELVTQNNIKIYIKNEKMALKTMESYREKLIIADKMVCELQLENQKLLNELHKLNELGGV